MATQVFVNSGSWPAPQGFPLSPTGLGKVSEVDNPYICRDDYIQTPQAIAMGITTASPIYNSGQLDKIILRASAWVNRYCSRWFDTQTIDEIKRDLTVRPFNPRLVNVIPNNGPIQQVNSMYIQVLQWYIAVLVDPLEQSYIQIQPDSAIIDIVPLLSTAGAGTGSPIPAQILDKVPLGKLWINYTFGFGQPLTGITAQSLVQNTVFQPSQTQYRLWAPSQTVNVYVDDSLIVDPTLYTIDYPNGIINFGTDLGAGHVVTFDATTNNTIPADVIEAIILLVTKYISDGSQNPMGFKSLNLNNYSVSFDDTGKDSGRMQEIKELMTPYKKNTWTVI